MCQLLERVVNQANIYYVEHRVEKKTFKNKNENEIKNTAGISCFNCLIKQWEVAYGEDRRTDRQTKTELMSWLLVEQRCMYGGQY